MTKNKLLERIIIHKIIPCKSGLGPTAFKLAKEIPVPIKKSVILNPVFDKNKIEDLISSGIRTLVLTKDARIKNKINQGNVDALLCFLKINDVKKTKGIIQRARANFTVVAIISASVP